MALHNLHEARRYYLEVVNETREDLKFVQSCAQRDNAQREIESSWRGLTELDLVAGHPDLAVADWESFRGGRFGDPSRRLIHTTEGLNLLVYAFLPGGLSGWLVDQHGIKAQHRLDGEQAIRQAAEFSALVADPDAPPDSVKASAQALDALLIGPFAEELPRDTMLVIDADGPLGSIPWAALENTHGEALIERFAFSQAIGWAEVRPTAQERNVDTTKALILGEPALGIGLDNQYPSLPSARSEAEALQRRLPNSVFRQGRDATLEAIKKYAPDSKLFHFAGHGVSYGGFGALVLAPSQGDNVPAQLITSDEISQVNLRGLQLAVLAACSSGAGEQSGMVNLDSLVRGFLDAGAVRVVAARWNVRSDTTSTLMAKFYEAILKKQRPAEALRQAVLQIRKNPETSHPYYWASFQVFGTP